MSFLTLMIIWVVCLLVEGFFSGSEMALVNADKLKLALATDAGSKRALTALHMVKHPGEFFSTTLLGTNITTITGSVVTTIYIIDNFGEIYAPLAIVYWPFTLVLGEIVPKSIYQHYADRIVLFVSPVLYGISRVFYPAVWAFAKLTDTILGSVKKYETATTALTREELEITIEMGRLETSDVRPAERTMISRVFDLADGRVEKIMTPLVDVVAIPVTSTREEAEAALAKHEFSRIPLYETSIFNIVGVLDGTDLIFGEPDASIQKLMRPAYYVPEQMPLDELLVAMKRRGEALAVAVDEYGAATGIVTAEDLLEEVVGEIRDEHDEVKQLYQRLGWKHYIVKGRMEIEEANDKLKLGIPTGDYETVAGFVIKKFEKIPKAGETFRHGRLRFTVLRATERAVTEVEIHQESEE